METLNPDVAAARPTLDEAGAVRLVREHWEREVTAHELASERDRVFRLEDETGPIGVLKVANGLEPSALIDLQNEMLQALAGADLDIACPSPVPTTGGEIVAEAEVDGLLCRARLLTFVDGVPLDEVHPQTAHLEASLGRVVARVDAVLASIEDPGARDIVWTPMGAADLIAANLGAIPDDGRAVVQRVLDSVAEEVVPVADRLPVSLVHNDAHGDNVLVDTGAADRPARIAGLVDFGDACETWRIGGLATACAYAGFDRPDPVETFANIATGYASVRRPSSSEADALFTLIRLRLALSVTVSAVRATQEPDNEYLTTSSDGAWSLLRILDGMSSELARYRLRAAMGLPAVPGADLVAAALSEAARAAGPVLDPDPRTAPSLVIDLSVETGDDGGTFDPGDHTRFNRFVFDSMRDAGAEVGIGRYDEVRWWYTTDEFIAAGNEMDQWRTVHLGIDLFAPPDTPVCSPLPGRVVSVTNNDDRLDYGPTVIVEHELPIPTSVDPEAANLDLEAANIHADATTVRFRTLYGHLSERTLTDTRQGQIVEAGETIAWLGAPPVNGDWAPHLHFQIIVDQLDYEGTFPGVAAPGQRDVWLALSPDPNLLLRIPEETTAPRPRPMAELEADRSRQLGPSLSLSYGRHLHIVRGRGGRLYDVEGQPYLDCVNNVTHVGHAHPRITEVARLQLGRLNTNTRYLHETILEYTDALTDRLPEPLSVCFLVCSGTEANELALRMARTHTKKTGAIVVDGAYHGNSSSVVNLSPYKFDGPGGKGVRPWVRVVPMPDPYRGRYRANGMGPGDAGSAADEAGPGDLGLRYAEHVGEALSSLNGDDGMYGSAKPLGAAAFFCESLLSCGGQIPLPPGYLGDAVRRVREVGAVYVADEVQVGFGRVGRDFWAFEEHGVVPDIVTLGKPIGNGHPLAAVVTTPEIASSFANGMEYFNTFGGNPVSCAIGLEVLRIIDEESLQENALEVGGHLETGLRDLMSRHASIGDVRGRGLFLGIEFVLDRDTREPDAATASKTVERMRDRGVLLSTDGPDHNVIKIKPPMVFSRADADMVVEGLDDVLSESWVGH